MATSVAALRALIQQRFPDATPLTGGAQTTNRWPRASRARQGAAQRRAPARTALGLGTAGRSDRHPSRHLPSVVASGERSAWIDGDNTVAGAFWSNASGLYLVRPKSRVHALRAAEELLRSGGFSLLVLAGTEPQGTETVRLTRAAREGGAALVDHRNVGVDGEPPTHLAAAALSLAPHAVRRSGGSTGRHGPRARARRSAGTHTPTFPFRSCIMSYVCLWSPSWPTAADFPADLVASLLGVAPRVAVGERGLVWGDARGLHGAPARRAHAARRERLRIRRRARRRGA